MQIREKLILFWAFSVLGKNTLKEFFTRAFGGTFKNCRQCDPNWRTRLVFKLKAIVKR